MLKEKIKEAKDKVVAKVEDALEEHYTSILVVITAAGTVAMVLLDARAKSSYYERVALSVAKALDEVKK